MSANHCKIWVYTLVSKHLHVWYAFAWLRTWILDIEVFPLVHSVCTFLLCSTQNIRNLYKIRSSLITSRFNGKKMVYGQSNGSNTINGINEHYVGWSWIVTWIYILLYYGEANIPIGAFTKTYKVYILLNI